MRYLAYLATLLLLGAAALAGQELMRSVEDPLPLAPETAVASVPDTPIAPQAAAPRDWPPLFGEVVVIEPQPPTPPMPEPEPQPPKPPAPPAPPIDSLGFALKGVVSDGVTRWAMVSHPTGEQLLKVGDKLGEHYEITRIDSTGLWGRSGPDAEPVLLGFAE